jgi:hypothetical protein
VSRVWSLLLLLAACETREVSVFDVTAGAAQGGAGASAGGSASGSGGTQTVVSGGAGSGGAGASSGGGGSSAGDVYGGGGSYETGGSSGAPPLPCMDDNDCGAGSVCDKHGCDLPFGLCKNAIFFCSDELKPVCGCDGVTYWNDCVRVGAGAVLDGQGQCTSNACPCDVGDDCEVPGASCSHLLPAGQMCGHGPGSCWMLPSTPATDKKRWRECRPPDQGGLGGCVSTYDAIISEHSHVEARRDDPCN